MNKLEAESRVPEHTLGGIKRYLEQRLPPGDFLYSVFCNDLKRSFASADEWNRNAMYDIVYYLYNYAPIDSWGSAERVEAWLNPEERSKGVEL